MKVRYDEGCGVLQIFFQNPEPHCCLLEAIDRPTRAPETRESESARARTIVGPNRKIANRWLIEPQGTICMPLPGP
jgi:hypothetical protein